MNVRDPSQILENASYLRVLTRRGVDTDVFLADFDGLIAFTRHSNFPPLARMRADIRAGTPKPVASQMVTRLTRKPGGEWEVSKAIATNAASVTTYPLVGWLDTALSQPFCFCSGSTAAMQTRIVIAVPWITRTEWRAWKSLDAETLPSSYLEWLNVAQKRVYELMLAGDPFELVAVHAEPCRNWCERRKMTPDAAARQAYADSRLSAGKPVRKRQTASSPPARH